MVALALAVERGRVFVEVGASLVAPFACRPRRGPEDGRDCFEQTRDDPVWGWERATWDAGLGRLFYG